MKLSLFSGVTYLLHQGGPKAVADFCVDLGIQGVEGFPCSELDSPADAKALRAALDDSGLVCPCFSAAVDLSAGNGEKAIDDLKRYLEMTAILGADKLHHTLVPGLMPPKVTSPTFASLFDRVVERAGLICDIAKPMGISCLYEDQGLYFNGCNRFEQFLLALDRDNAGVCADFGNIYFVDEEPCEFVARFMPYIRHSHVKDYLFKSKDAPDPGDNWLMTRQGNRLMDCVCGYGIVPFVDLFAQMQRGGYDGWYSLEYSSIAPFEFGNRRSAENLRNYYEMASRRWDPAKA